MSNASFEQIAVPVAIGAGAWFAALPGLREVRECNPDNIAYRVNMIHTEVCVGLITLSVGVLGSIMLKDKGPAIAAFVVIAGLVTFYEATFSMKPIEKE